MTEYIITLDETKADFDGNVPISAKWEVVRCRDCKHFMNGDLCNLQDEWNEFHWLQVEPDGFCAWATKRGEI